LLGLGIGMRGSLVPMDSIIWLFRMGWPQSWGTNALDSSLLLIYINI